MRRHQPLPLLPYAPASRNQKQSQTQREKVHTLRTSVALAADVFLFLALIAKQLRHAGKYA